MSEESKKVTRESDFVLLTGRSNYPLAAKIAKILKKEIDEPITIFADGEVRVRINPNLRRRHVFIIQPTSSPVNDHLMELILMIDAAKRASAKEITAIIPYFGYSRQDRKEMPRVPVSAATVANMIEHVGADRIVTVDIHSEPQLGFVKIPWDNLYASYSLIPAIKAKKFSNLVVASPDKGGVKRATGYAKLLGAGGIAILYKERDITLNNKSETMEMVGDVKGKDVLIVDDMIDTAGSIVQAANHIREKGARRVFASATHGLFSGPALERITNSSIDEVIVTDTIKLRDEALKNKKIKVASVAPLLAEAITRIRTGQSLTKALFL
ncbi:MAG: ribose-phosphate pyrophosphokinase [Patescibacteria group bacterium]|nr:ribose-phosphate pyrophosphokinase [Patescibacteria group bacterium]